MEFATVNLDSPNLLTDVYGHAELTKSGIKDAFATQDMLDLLEFVENAQSILL